MNRFSSFEDNFNPIVAASPSKIGNNARFAGGGDASSPAEHNAIRLPPPSQGFAKTSTASSAAQSGVKNGRPHEAVKHQVSLPGPPSIIDKGDQGAAAAAAASAAAAAAALASPGTRVYKKSSPNGKITIYIGKRDFIDHGTYVDPIDGVVLVDPEYMTSQPGTRVWVHVLAAFRYGREDLDVLGLTFRKDLFLAHQQIFPVPKGDDASTERRNNDRPLTKLQERLLKKLGQHAYPFFFELPTGTTPASVTLQPAPGDTGKPCGVDYELKAYVAPAAEDKPHKRDVIRLAIRKLYYAPPETMEREQPSCEVSKDFVMSPGRLHLECTLDKEMYYHGESIAINVQITNNSTKTVKKIKASVIQLADICLFSAARYKCPVAELESEHGFPVGPGFTLSKVYWLTPLLANNREKRGLALDGKLKHEDTNLASSTPLPKNATVEDKENLGIVVSYRVRVKLSIGGLGAGDLVSELAFTLTHPKPKPEVDDGKLNMQEEIDSKDAPGEAGKTENNNAAAGSGASQPEVDLNLIELDTADTPAYADQNEDLIFEDFARLRLTGNQPASSLTNGSITAAAVGVPNYAAAAAAAANSNGLSLSPSSIDPFHDLHNQQHAASFVSTQQPQQQQLTLSSNNPFLDDFVASASSTASKHLS